MNKPYPATNYSDYLCVDQLTSAQKRKSVEYGQPAHDEMLFIIAHQAYELWFKQILFEIDSVLSSFNQPVVDESAMLTMGRRLERVIEIQKVLLSQIDVLETMTPLDFLDFREFLVPASGFQSHQFRLIENKMGLNRRLKFNNQDYKKLLKDDEASSAQKAETEASLFDCLEKWLERTPFISDGSFDFWALYRKTIQNSFAQAKEEIKSSGVDKESLQKHLDSIDASIKSFDSIFNEEEFAALKEKNLWRLSHKALQAALFIQLYRDEPLLQAPFHLMTCLQDIDENFTQWRQRHALMAHRMLGAKMGTGGSSGHKYLSAAADKHKVFTDLFNLATFLIPRSKLPPLPEEIKKKLRFQY